jgi:DnaK suppressor protein
MHRQRSGPKMLNMNHEAIRQQLLQRKHELQQRSGKVSSDLRREGEALVADFADQAVQTQNDEVLHAIGESGAREIQQIDRALERLKAGTYGRCQRCGVEIAAARLKAIPFATHCAACA